MNSYDKTIAPSLTFNIKNAMICEYFKANTWNSGVIQYWPVSIVFSSLLGTAKLAIGEYVNWLQ